MASNRQFIDIGTDGDLLLNCDEAPAPGPENVLIEVEFAGVNRADVLQRMGLYPPPADASPIMGLEVAGRIAAVGPGVSHWAVGDRVCALVHGGGYASHCIARADHCLALPDSLDSKQAAALPEALLTVWHNVFQRGGLQAGETVLIHGGTSGIGTLGIQMAKAMGSTVLATAGSTDKCRQAEALGAKFAANYREGDLVAQFAAAGYKEAINVVLDIAGGDFCQVNFDLAAVDGRIVCIGMMRGASAEINLMSVLGKRLTLTGSTLRRMNTAEKAAAFAEIQTHIMPKVLAGEINPIIHAVYPLAEALAAQALMQSGTHSGKILLDCRC